MLEYKARRKALGRRSVDDAYVQALAALDAEFPDEAAIWKADSQALAQVIPTPTAPTTPKPAAKPAKKAKNWNIGEIETEAGQRKIIDFLRNRRCVLTGEQGRQLEELVYEIKGNDAEGVKTLKPSARVISLLGESQLPRAAIEWILRFCYPFPTPWEQDEEGEDSLSYALLLVAIATTQERFIYLPTEGRAFRRHDRQILTEGAAVAELQQWFGANFDEKKIRRRLRAECRQAERVLRLPGRDAYFTHKGRRAVNLWTPSPWPVFSVTDDDVRPYLDLVNYICGEEADLMLDYMAHQIHGDTCGRHCRWGWIIISREHQTGKEAMAKIFAEALGSENMTRGTSEELGGKAESGAFLARGTMILFSEERVTYDQLEKVKEISGSEEATVRLMNKNVVVMPHGAFFFIVSNRSDCVALDNKNVRFMVVYHAADRRDESFYDELNAWEADNGPAKLANWLRQRAAVRKINPSVRPYATAAELELIDNAGGPVVADIRALILSRADPFEAELIELDVARRAIAEGVTIPDSSKLGTRFQKDVSNFHMQRALESAGAVPLGQERVAGRDRKVSLWALGHAEEWQGLNGDAAPAIRAAGLEMRTFADACGRGGAKAPKVIAITNAPKGGRRRF